MENEAQKARERAFDAGLIGRGRVVDSGVENVVLIDFNELVGSIGGDAGGLQREAQFDLNVSWGTNDGGVRVWDNSSVIRIASSKGVRVCRRKRMEWFLMGLRDQIFSSWDQL